MQLLFTTLHIHGSESESGNRARRAGMMGNLFSNQKWTINQKYPAWPAGVDREKVERSEGTKSRRRRRRRRRLPRRITGERTV